jgi:fructose-1,6-bisphosphatase I
MPEIGDDLDAFLSAHGPDVADALLAIAGAASQVVRRIRLGALAGRLDQPVGPARDGVAQKALDVFADEAFISALAQAGVRAVLTEERDDPVVLDSDGRFLVAIDPLDGSGNIDAGGPMGAIFSILDAPVEAFRASHFLERGSAQRAAGLVMFGPRVDFVFSCGEGAHIATLDPEDGRFRISRIAARVPPATREFAINASNFRHWPTPVRAYVEDCLEGDQGPRGGNFNMRWLGAVAGEAYRILLRGGVYLYPADSRQGYENGRLRLLYEANPIAFILEQAGGAAIDGFQRILSLTPPSLHARTPLIFGSKDKVERIGRYYAEGRDAPPAPLFAKRSLLRR